MLSEKYKCDQPGKTEFLVAPLDNGHFITGGLQIVLKNTDGSVIRFNPQREIENTLKKFRLSSAGDELRVSGTLQPFYDSLTKDFLSKAN